MKHLILFFSFLLLLQITQASPVFATCVTEVGPTTSFVIETVGETVNLRALNHNGMKFAPFWNSLVVPNDLLVLQERSNTILKLPTELNASWKTSQCEFGEGKIFSCFGQGTPLTIGGLVVKTWAVYSVVKNEKSFAGEYTWIELSFSFSVNDVDHQIIMRYQDFECPISKTKITYGS